MWIALAVLLALGTLWAALVAAAMVRPVPRGLLLAHGLAIWIGLHAALACLLSPLGLVGRGAVAAAQALAVAAAALALARLPAARRAARRLARVPLALRRWEVATGAAALGVLAILPAVSAAAYPPTNWDSMTYRMGRVAHWLQQASVAPFPTHVDRQVALSPGAEYALLALQAVSGSDRLANGLQLLAWLAVAAAVSGLVRAAGGGRLLAAAAAVIAASPPMAMLQASTTQNDLVAAAAALSIAGSAWALLRAPARFRARHGALLGAGLAAALLVKPTALLAAAPLLAVASWRALRALGPDAARTLGPAALAALATAAALAGPDAALRLGDPAVRAANAAYAGRFTHPPLEASADRALNLLRGVARHLPTPAAVRSALDMPAPDGCQGLAPCRGLEARRHDTVAGNGWHLLAFLGLCAVALARGRTAPPAARLLLGTTAAAWVLFQLTFRDNEWLSRLEVPLFALVGTGVLALASPRRGWAVAGLALAAALAAEGLSAALGHETQPPLQALAAPPEAASAYYTNAPGLKATHDVALQLAGQLGCARLGLYLGEDSWDYPLTWRAMAAGIETRHVFPGDRWACLIFTDGQNPAAPPPAWRPIPAAPLLRLNTAAAPPPGVRR